MTFTRTERGASELRREITRLEAENAFLQRQLDIAAGELVRLRAAAVHRGGYPGLRSVPRPAEAELRQRLEDQ